MKLWKTNSMVNKLFIMVDIQPSIKYFSMNGLTGKWLDLVWFPEFVLHITYDQITYDLVYFILHMSYIRLFMIAIVRNFTDYEESLSNKESM